MFRMTLFLALATAWCADAVLMFALAEAGWGSIMNRMFATLLFGLAQIALAIAIGPQVWRAIEPRARHAIERMSLRLWAYWTLMRATHEARPVSPSHLATPAP